MSLNLNLAQCIIAKKSYMEDYQKVNLFVRKYVCSPWYEDDVSQSYKLLYEEIPVKSNQH